MNEILLGRLDKLESALATLIDSISSYTPSVPAAHALLDADDSLQKSLTQLSVHQRNHARILRLRETIDRQDAQIKSHITKLADLRTDLLSTPTSLPPPDRREVPYTELLDYAKRISRFTVPPGFRPAVTVAPPTTTTNPTTAAAATNNEGGEAVGGGSGGGSGGGAGGTQGGEGEEGKGQEGIGFESLLQTEKQWLDPFTGVQFTPWPSEEVIKRSALAQIQASVERGVDVGGDGGEGLGAAEMRDGGEVEFGGGEQAVEVEGVRPSAPPDMGPRVERREERPKVFGGLDLYDPDED